VRTEQGQHKAGIELSECDDKPHARSQVLLGTVDNERKKHETLLFDQLD
jgi:hypothetical protein